jgi:hypothetical protein
MVNLLLVLKIIALLATAVTGLLALIKPQSAQGFTGLTIAGPRGITEVRAVFGGAFIALGVAPLILISPAAYQLVGIMYLAIALVRATSMVLDKSVVKSNVISLAAEIVLGGILVL